MYQPGLLLPLPLKNQGYAFSKQLLCGLIRIGNGWHVCRVRILVQICKKEGFISIRDNNIRNVTDDLLKEVCRDVCAESKLQPLTGEMFKESTALILVEACYNISDRGFWYLFEWHFQTSGCSTEALMDVQTKASANPMKSTKRSRNELITKRFKQSSLLRLLRQ